ncbi:MAG: right-handed parallel beta-helix repeat-containing protein [Planctomycetota bacterium]
MSVVRSYWHTAVWAAILVGVWTVDAAEPNPAGDAPVVSVVADGSGDYRTIQEAVDHAPEEAVVQIGKGTWNEAVLVTRPLTLVGAGWEHCRIVSASAGKRGASPELIAGLSQIARELDAETQEKLQEAFLKVFGASPALTVKGAARVVVRNIAFLRSEPVRKGSFKGDTAIAILDSDVEIENCAVLESPGTGVSVEGDSHVKLKHCLIANAWGKGVVVGVSKNGSFEASECEIRNNQYSGMSIGSPSPAILVTRCRIDGAGWHGIRYDGCSPRIEDNVFHRTAVSGIYASGATSATVRNNLFYHSGMSCWFQNGDTIESNTFVGDRNSREKGGITQGLQVLGTSQPTVRRNLFVGCESAVSLGDIGFEGPHSKSTGKVTLVENSFWDNERNLSRYDVQAKAEQSLPLPEGNLEKEPQFVAAEKRDFELAEGSPLMSAGIGARGFAPFESPWPVQPEEQRSIEAVAERLQQTGGSR